MTAAFTGVQKIEAQTKTHNHDHQAYQHFYLIKKFFHIICLETFVVYMVQLALLSSMKRKVAQKNVHSFLQLLSGARTVELFEVCKT